MTSIIILCARFTYTNELGTVYLLDYLAPAQHFSTELATCKLIKLVVSFEPKRQVVSWIATPGLYISAKFRSERFLCVGKRA